jgi:exodeoxyribonuclease V beta subunit
LNFRSTLNLIDAFNIIFDQKAVSPFFSGNITYDASLECGKKSFRAVDARGRDIVPVKLVRVSPWGEKLTTREFRVKMGRYIASEIKAILSDSRALLRIGEGEDLRPVTAGEIFILTRKDKEGIEISEYLREADVPFAFYKREGLFQTREAEEIRDVLSAVEKPFDQSRRFRAWLTPFFGVPLESLLACKDLPETEQIARKLLDWHFLSNKRRYQELFARILDESGIVRREIFFKEHERELTNYLHIFEILLEEVSSSVCDVSELISSLNGFINGTRNPMREDGNIQRLETDKEAVQIMTMHKSKGLEASVVFIYGGMTAFPKSDLATFHENGKRVLYIGDMPSDIKALSDAEIRDEDQRLMYVAATRAKARLYLPYVAPDQMNSYMNGSYPKMIQRLKDIVSDPHEKLFKIEDAEVHGPAGSENGRGPIKDTLSSWKPSESLLADYDDWERFNTLRERHAGFEVTSYSRIKMRKGGYSVPLENAEYGEEAGGVGYPLNDEEYVGGAEFGAAIHKVFEGIPFEPLRGGVLSFDAWSARGETASLFRDALLGSGINLRHLRYSQRLVFNALTANVVVKDGPMISGLCSVASSLREVEFIYPYPEDSHTRLSDFPSGDFVIERGYVKGFIDFLFEHDGIVYFCDWKTDTLPEYSASVLRKHFEENYVLQTKLYLIALARMLKLHSRQEYDRRFGGVIYCFVRGMVTGGQGSQGIVFTRPSWDELLSYEEELLRSTEYIGGSLE